jgi:hypothetical protein
MTEWIGYKWLAERHQITPVHPFRIESHLGSSRKSTTQEGLSREVYPPAFRPTPDPKSGSYPLPTGVESTLGGSDEVRMRAQI